MTEDTINLYYFDQGGRAEVTRLILTIGDIKFNDIRLTRDEFKAKKESGFFKFGQAPVIEINGKQFAQSNAIETWAALKTNILPTDEILQLRDEESRQLYNDMLSKFLPSLYEQDPQKKSALRANYASVELPKFLSFAEKLLQESSGEYFTGIKFSVSDITWYVGLKWHMSGVIDGLPVGFIHNYPRLRNMFYSLHFHPKVRFWNDTHSKIVLHYFNVPGRAGGIRLGFHVAGIPFQDRLYNFENFQESQKQGKFKFNQVPVLEVDGKQYAQSLALENFAATKAGLLPVDPFQKMRCDEARQLLADLIDIHVQSARGSKPEELSKLKEKYANEDFPKYMKYLDSLLASGGTTFLSSNTVSIADYSWYTFLKSHLPGGRFEVIAENYLKQNWKNVQLFMENFVKDDLIKIMDKYLNIL